MQKVRILHWDDEDYHSYVLRDKGLEVETIKLEVYIGYRYRVVPSICANAQRLTMEKAVDLVILGNNLGTGLTNAEFIADPMKEKTIVVWNYYQPGQEDPYAAMGFRHFCSRRDLEKFIPKVLGLS